MPSPKSGTTLPFRAQHTISVAGSVASTLCKIQTGVGIWDVFTVRLPPCTSKPVLPMASLGQVWEGCRILSDLIHHQGLHIFSLCRPRQHSSAAQAHESHQQMRSPNSSKAREHPQTSSQPGLAWTSKDPLGACSRQISNITTAFVTLNVRGGGGREREGGRERGRETQVCECIYIYTHTYIQIHRCTCTHVYKYILHTHIRTHIHWKKDCRKLPPHDKDLLKGAHVMGVG